MRNRKITAAVAAVVGLLISVVLTAAPVHAARGADVELVNSVSGKCADVNNWLTTPGAVVHQWDCHNDANQLWHPRDLLNGYLQYVNVNSGLCLNVRGGEAAVSGALLEQDVCDAHFPSIVGKRS